MISKSIFSSRSLSSLYPPKVFLFLFLSMILLYHFQSIMQYVFINLRLFSVLHNLRILYLCILHNSAFCCGSGLFPSDLLFILPVFAASRFAASVIDLYGFMFYRPLWRVLRLYTVTGINLEDRQLYFYG